MLPRMLRKSVCVTGTGGYSCMPNLHTLYHPSQTLGQGRGGGACQAGQGPAGIITSYTQV